MIGIYLILGLLTICQMLDWLWDQVGGVNGLMYLLIVACCAVIIWRIVCLGIESWQADCARTAEALSEEDAWQALVAEVVDEADRIVREAREESR